MEANWQKTVINLDNFGDFGGVSPYWLEVIKENQRLQAKITWNIAFKAGIKEVVEWVYKNSYQGRLPITKINNEEWHIKLKEWKVE